MHDVIQGKYMHNAEIDNILETDDSYNILQLLGFFQQMHFLAWWSNVTTWFQKWEHVLNPVSEPFL